MLLAIDAGNSNVVLGVFQGAGLRATWRLPTDRDRSGEAYGARVRACLAEAGIPLRAIEGVVIASVVPALEPALEQLSRAALGREPAFVGRELGVRMASRYDPATPVGIDRLLNARAAVRRHGAPVLVIDCGTATKVDVVDADGVYRGGAILPGLGISMDALYRAAPHLPRVELTAPARVIGASTTECMQSGAVYGFCGQVEGLVRRIREELGTAPPVVATGGFSGLLAAGTRFIDHLEPHLTLEGLRIAWEEARPPDGIEPGTLERV